MEVKREIINGRIVKKIIWKGKLTNNVRAWLEYCTEYNDPNSERKSLPLVYPYQNGQFLLSGESDGSDLQETLIEVKWTNGEHSEQVCLHVTPENIDLDHHEIVFHESEEHGELIRSILMIEGCPRTIMENKHAN